MVTGEGKGRKSDKLGEGSDIYTLLHIKQVTNKDWRLPRWLTGNLPDNSGDAGSIPGSGRSPGERMAIHSSMLAWRTLQTEEPCGLWSIGSQRVGHV